MENIEEELFRLKQQVAYLSRMLRNIIFKLDLTREEIQALDDVIDDLPEVSDKDFRW